MLLGFIGNMFLDVAFLRQSRAVTVRPLEIARGGWERQIDDSPERGMEKGGQSPELDETANEPSLTISPVFTNPKAGMRAFARTDLSAYHS